MPPPNSEKEDGELEIIGTSNRWIPLLCIIFTIILVIVINFLCFRAL